MNFIQKNAKGFELVSLQMDPAYPAMIDAIVDVKEFIIRHGLIIYGGTAIDMALRLKGDKIYPDDSLKVPDLDFYSPDNVEHSYQLADILYKKGHVEAKSTVGQHTETMHVDVIDNHYVADLSYRPRAVFDRLPTLEYDGMKIIHPDFQRIDVHSSLAFPYDNPPREVVFERWKKDLERFNLLIKYYPILPPAHKLVPALRSVTIPISLRKNVLAGFAAYAIFYCEHLASGGSSVGLCPATFEVAAEAFSFSTWDQRLELVHFNPAKLADKLGATGIHRYEKYINLSPERIDCVLPAPDSTAVTIYSTKDKLLAASSTEVSGVMFRVVGIQYLCKHFLSKWFELSQGRELYLACYVSLLKMIEHATATVVATATTDELPLAPVGNIMFPSVSPFGDRNINLARKIALNRMQSDLYGKRQYKIPYNYYPGRSIPKGGAHPTFVHEDFKYFREEGREIIKSTAPTEINDDKRDNSGNITGGDPEDTEIYVGRDNRNS